MAFYDHVDNTSTLQAGQTRTNPFTNKTEVYSPIFGWISANGTVDGLDSSEHTSYGSLAEQLGLNNQNYYNGHYDPITGEYEPWYEEAEPGTPNLMDYPSSSSGSSSANVYNINDDTNMANAIMNLGYNIANAQIGQTNATNAMNYDIWQQSEGLTDSRLAAQYAFNANQAQINRDWEHSELAQARSWEESLSNTAHQREVQDLISAGLNPILAAGGSGASTPISPTPQSYAASGQAIGAKTMQMQQANVVGAFSAAGQFIAEIMGLRTTSAIAAMNNSTNRYNAETNRYNAQSNQLNAKTNAYSAMSRADYLDQSLNQNLFNSIINGLTGSLNSAMRFAILSSLA